MRLFFIMDNIYWTSFKTFFKIGAFTLGGGYAMIPIIEEEVVNKNKWVSHEEMLDLIAVALAHSLKMVCALL